MIIQCHLVVSDAIKKNNNKNHVKSEIVSGVLLSLLRLLPACLPLAPRDQPVAEGVGRAVRRGGEGELREGRGEGGPGERCRKERQVERQRKIRASFSGREKTLVNGRSEEEEEENNVVSLNTHTYICICTYIYVCVCIGSRAIGISPE